MNRGFRLVLGWTALTTLLGLAGGHDLQGRQPASAGSHGPAAKTETPKHRTGRRHGWTLDEALAQLALHPNDAYLQFVVMQLARREDKVPDVAPRLAEILQLHDPGQRVQADLFSLFTGALALQENIQQDAMMGEALRAAAATPLDEGAEEGPEGPAPPPAPPPSKSGLEEKTDRKDRTQKKDRRPRLRVEEQPAPAKVIVTPDGVEKTEEQWQRDRDQRAALQKRRKEIVDLATLHGPQIKSHPWKKLLQGRKPAVSALSRCVPADFYLAEFRSVSKLLATLEIGDLWGKAFSHQALQDARMRRVADRLRQQLALPTDSLLEPFYDLVVDEVAITGSDLFVGEGSDVTVLFHYWPTPHLQAKMDGFLAQAHKSRTDARRTTGEYLGVKYTHVQTPGREIDVYSAYPREGLHVRSNSKVALKRVLEAIKGHEPDGREVARLGDTDEFAYIRTLMPRGAREEDGFIYLSDRFIRRLVGPAVKLTERRRLLCHNHLKMIGHAALLYRTEKGKWPASLDDLARADCCPGTFNKGDLVCPHGGTYALSKDGTHGVCSHHGASNALTPCCEMPLTKVNGQEADAYKKFQEEYSQYWRTYFDPIALRIQLSPKHYRLETVVLPLMDNSIYTTLAAALGGKPEPLDALPIPRKNMFSLNLRINKKKALQELRKFIAEAQKDREGKAPERDLDSVLQDGLRDCGVPARAAERLTVKRIFDVLDRGLGNQVGLHVCDADPMFDLNFPNLLNLLPGALSTGNVEDYENIGELVTAAVFVMPTIAPGYLSIPVRDADLVDEFLKGLDPVLAVLARSRSAVAPGIAFEQDFYKFHSPAKYRCRAYGFRVGPLKLRVFFARVGGSLYVTTKPYILEDIIAAEENRARLPAQGKTADPGPTGHAMIRLRPQHWDRVLKDFRLAWAENNRQACLNNLGPLASVGRALAAQPAGAGHGSAQSWDSRGRSAQHLAETLYGTPFECPEGGRYLVSPDGKHCRCSIHGSALSPRQPAAPGPDSPLGKLLSGFGDMTATMTFLPEGLRAVVTIDRN